MASKKRFDFRCGERVSERRGRGISLSLEWALVKQENEAAEGWEDREQTIGLLSEWWVKTGLG